MEDGQRPKKGANRPDGCTSIFFTDTILLIQPIYTRVIQCCTSVINFLKVKKKQIGNQRGKKGWKKKNDKTAMHGRRRQTTRRVAAVVVIVDSTSGRTMALRVRPGTAATVDGRLVPRQTAVPVDRRTSQGLRVCVWCVRAFRLSVRPGDVRK